MVKHYNQSNVVGYTFTRGSCIHVAQDGSVGPVTASFYSRENRPPGRSVVCLKHDQCAITDHPFWLVIDVKLTGLGSNRPFFVVGFVLFFCCEVLPGASSDREKR